MPTYKLSIFALLATLLVSACTNTSGIRPLSDSELTHRDWQHHQQQVLGIDNWTAEGKAAIKNGADGSNMNLYWRQETVYSSVRLSGPLGQGATTINAYPEYAEFIQGDDYYASTDLTSLVDELTNLPLPVNGFKYWLLGLPSPDSDAILKINDQAVLNSLQQDGWTVEFSDYSLQQQIALPSKIVAIRGDQSAKVIIKRWQLE